MDFWTYYPYEPNSSPEGEFFRPYRASRHHDEFLSISDNLLSALRRDLDVFPGESKDPGTGLPLSIRFHLPVYKNEEKPWEIEATNKLLHDQYTATYWKLVLQKLQKERGEKDESSSDPSSLSSLSKESEDDSRKETSSSSGHSSPKSRKRKKRCRLVTQAATSRKGKYRSFGVSEERPVVTAPVGRRRQRLGSWEATRARVRYWKKALRKVARKKRESKLEFERHSSGSDPEPGSPGTRRSVDYQGKLLVSEDYMTVVAMNIPYEYLNFHPSTTKYSSMEMSVGGIMTALYEIRRQLTFYRNVARYMCLEIIRSKSRPRPIVPVYLKQNLLIFLKNFFTFQNLLRTVVSLNFEGSDCVSKLNVLSLYEHVIEKQIVRISQIRNAIICHVDPKTKRMKDELEDYYKAICDLKVV